MVGQWGLSNPGYCQVIFWSLQTDCKAILLKTPPKKLIEYGKVKVVPTRSLHSYQPVLVHSTGRHSVDRRWEGKPNAATKLSICEGDYMPASYAGAKVAPDLWEESTTTWLNFRLPEWDRTYALYDAAWVAKKRRLIAQEPMIKSNTTALLKKCNNKMTLNNILLCS